MDAPTVFAIVLRQRIADIALSGLCLSFLRVEAPFTPCSSSPVMNESGVERSVASRVEHSAESATDIIIIMYIVDASMSYRNSAIIVSLALTLSPIFTFMSASRGRYMSILEPNLIIPHCSPLTPFVPGSA